MRLRRALPLALALSVCLAPVAHGAVPRDFTGVTSEDILAGDAGYRAANLSAQRALGIGLIRQTFHWREIERSPGDYDLSFYDAYVATAAAHGIRILPVLFNAPSFRAPGSGRPACPPYSNASMGSFAQALVRRYGPNGSLWDARPDVPKLAIRSWQVWNEPNLGVYWCNRPNARNYARMLRDVGGAIKAVDRRAEIVTAGLPPSKLQSAIPIERYIKALYRYKGARYFDTLAINSYAKNRRELGTLLKSIRRIMNKRRDRRAKIWITEIGWGDSGPAHRFIVGASRQASLIQSSLAYIRSNRRKLKLRGFVYFSWRDAPPYPPLYQDLWGLHTGLLDINGAPKPALFALYKATASLRR